jgi:hypothetical protein
MFTRTAQLHGGAFQAPLEAPLAARHTWPSRLLLKSGRAHVGRPSGHSIEAGDEGGGGWGGGGEHGRRCGHSVD